MTCALPPSPLPSGFCPRPRPAPPPGIKTTFLHGHYLFFVPFSFVRNSHKNQCKTIRVGVLFYITKALGDPRKGGVLAGGGRGRSALLLPRGATAGWGILRGPLGLDGEGQRCLGDARAARLGVGQGLVCRTWASWRTPFLALLAGSREVVGVGCWILECKAEGRPGPLSPPELSGGILVPTGPGP